MTDDLYERYKEALRTGHVAVLRGALDEAVRAYRDAAAIAPSRALPHTSLGGVHIRLGHLEDALAEFAAAVALDHVAQIQEAAGRLSEAADTLRRAVELEVGPERIRRQRALLREIRISAGDHAAEHLLARALRLRDEPGGDAIQPAAGQAFMGSQAAARSTPPPVSARVWPTMKPAPVEAPEPALADLEPEPLPAPAPEPALGTGAAELVVAAGAERPGVGMMEGVQGSSASMPGAIGGSEHQPTGDEFLAAAEAADLAGDSIALRSLLLWTARAYAREGRFEAGLDATHRLLQRAPSDVDAHLVLVELYVARGWDGLAAEKLRLLGRLADLDDDEETRRRLCVAATRAFPEDSRLQDICS